MKFSRVLKIGLNFLKKIFRVSKIVKNFKEFFEKILKNI